MANITIKRYNGSSWDIHYPKTTIAQVINLSTSLANMQSDINGKLASSHASASNPHDITPALIGALTQTLGDARYLGKTAKAADSSKLNGQAASYYATQSDLTGKIDLKSNTDNRTVVTKPNDYNSKLSIAGLKQNTTIGVSGEGTYSGVIGIRGWTDSSGGNAHELAFGGNGGLYHRHGATTSWNTWKKIAYLEDFGAWAKKSSLDHGDIPYATSITKGGVRVNVVGTSVYLYTTD